MGQEIRHFHYTESEEREFGRRLREETKWLKNWILSNRKFPSPLKCGYEAEGWIVTAKGLPAPCSDEFLKSLDDGHITPELSKCNFEINGNCFPVNQSLALNLQKDFQMYWEKSLKSAKRLNKKITFIGTYPDLSLIPFGINEIFPRKRYYAINDRIKAFRKAPAHIYISGLETWELNALSIMHEAQTTSLQIHFQVAWADAVDVYNSSLLASPIMGALCANSPYICGKALWQESRVPLFEQIVGLKIKQGEREISRVGLGHGFVENCISELFAQNLLRPALLPDIEDAPVENLKHLSLHNGTIWRWNRPVIGIDKITGAPSFRVEHRVPSAGPTLIDMQANILFFIGLVHFIKGQIKNKKIHLSFAKLERSFYRACKEGLSSEIPWIDGKSYRIDKLVSEKLISEVCLGLKSLSLTDERSDFLINQVIKNRALSGQTGSVWQRSFVEHYGKRFEELIQCYLKNQEQDLPVFQWGLEK